MQSIPVFFDMTKFADVRRKNADVSRTQKVCHLIHIFFGYSLGKINCATFHHCSICVTNIRERGPFCTPPSVSSPENAHPE